MAPIAPFAHPPDIDLGFSLARRAESEACSGWKCLSDAAQFGIILVVLSFVGILGYLYWRFKIRPNLKRGDDGHTVTGGYWEVTRRDANRVSITIYREPREPRERRAQAPQADDTTETQRPRRGKEDRAIGRAPTQPGIAGTSEIHLVPPPPPSVPPPSAYWPAAPTSAPTPLPPFGLPSSVPPGHPTNSSYPTAFDVGAATVHYPPYAPPPYLPHVGSQSLRPHDSGLGKATTDKSAGAHPPARPSGPSPPPASHFPRSGHEGQGEGPQVAQSQRRQRRQYPMDGAPSPPPGHARTVSDSGSTFTASPMPSPPPSPRGASIRNRGRDHLRHPPGGRPRRAAASHRRQLSWQDASDSARRKYHATPRRQSELACSSEYLISDTEEAHATTAAQRRSDRWSSESPDRERRSRRDREPASRLGRSNSVRMSTLLRHRLPTSPAPRRPPSSDLQFPSPERRRARVSFTVPEETDEMSTPSSRDSSPVRRSGTRCSRSHGQRDRSRRRPEARVHRKEPGLAERVSAGFYRLRRALRGEI